MSVSGIIAIHLPQFGNERQVYPRNPERKMFHTQVKKYPDPDRPEIKFPDPDRPEIKFPDPTRPKNILKNVPRPRTGFGPVRSGPGKLGVSGCPAGLYFKVALLPNYHGV